MVSGKEVDVGLMILFLVLFIVTGIYIGVSDQKGEKVIDVDTNYVWDVEEGTIKKSPKKIIVPPIESKPVIIEKIKPEALAPNQGNVRTITIKNTKYDPGQISVSVGTTVVWVNADLKRNYRIYEKSVKRRFNSEIIKPGQSFNYTFNEKGTYYFNDAFFTYMNGVVIVE